jgi:hypothetical protein
VLVLVSFVLVLAAAVTLVVGLLQSGLTLIYLSIGCSVLAGVVLAVAVLRGRPEPRSAGADRSFTPPVRQQVPATVGAPPAATTTTRWNDPPASSTPPPPPPPPPSPAPEAAAGSDLATRAAGSALLGRLRGRKAEQEAAEPPVAAEPVPVAVPAAPSPADADRTAAMPVVGADEDDDGFPIADYDRMRATELLALLPGLDRNQLEAVRQRESSGKNRFTVMSRIDSLLAAKEEPAWAADDDEWGDEAGTDAETEAVLIEAEALREEEDFDAALEQDELDEMEDDEVAELVSPAGATGGFPIEGYETLTVGQILPRLSDMNADELAQVRSREQQGRNRGTVLDRIDRLSARAGAGAGSGAMAMPAPAAPARKAPARRSGAKAAPAPPPVAKKARAPRAAKAVPVPAAPVVPAPVKATRKAAPRKAAVVPVPPTPAPAPAPAARKVGARARKAPAAVEPAAPTVAEVIKKTAKRAPAKRATKRP